MRAGDLANITTLSFDGDATLWDFEKVMRYALETDVAGANRAGAISAWLNRDHLPNQTDFEPDYEISALDELLPLLGVKEEKRVG